MIQKEVRVVIYIVNTKNKMYTISHFISIILIGDYIYITFTQIYSVPLNVLYEKYDETEANHYWNFSTACRQNYEIMDLPSRGSLSHCGTDHNPSVPHH